MLYKPRTISAELQTLKRLHLRMKLSPKDKQYFLHLHKGFEGELNFDAWTETLQCDCLILNDLLLKMNNTIFQIDSLIITADKIYFYEVKNYEGDFVYDAPSEKFHKTPQQEIVNPLHQLARSTSLLSQLLTKYRYTIPIEGLVVFINSEFTLYQAPLHKPFIYPNQIKRYMKQCNMIASKLNRNHFRLADQLLSLHIHDSPYKQLPIYSYDQLQKGVTCLKCNSFAISIKGSTCICEHCKSKEAISTAVMRAVKEFQLLFPEQKVTTNIIHDWCRVVKSKRTIIRILSQHLHVVRNHRWTYYY
ncbi:NERD domain-containing protein [Virgibacillus sp. NKC19-3]|uniref:nuclease-related domain-containing protein n=1 Tax=Virgibacillus saliphilus TaxID=2831674 RepID=UPI001C9B5634|nr:nuclease-related domain-containing protein [Virgibacillus sp. NKC19-3]MBY7144962.1 NERD domain-containing protein [Virgibacillus sp. NKC19-3]